MKAMSKEGRVLDIPEEKIEALKVQLKGSLTFPGESAYEDSRKLWNAMIERHPSFVVKCIGAGDVLAGVRFALENDLLLSVKGGGHNIAGLAAADGAMMLDLSMMRGVWVDRKSMSAFAQGGCLLGDVDRETQLHGLATVLGFVSLTGVGGLTLGGGFGYLTRRWGWTSDNVKSMEVVTAEGKIVRASPGENSDLFWGLCGGGGNFGVVTGIEYALHEVGPEITGGMVAWNGSEADKVLELYRELAENAPREITLVAILRPAPPAPWLPKEIHGKLIAGILACCSEENEETAKIIGKIKSFGAPVGDVLIRRPYVQLQAMLDPTQPKGRRYYWKSEYLAEAGKDFCSKLIDHSAGFKSPHSGLIIFQIGGKLNEYANDHSAVGNRDAKYVVNIGGSWEKQEDDDANIAWARDTWEDIRSFSTGGTYINFLTEDEGVERTKDALGSSMARLSEIKSEWDPENFFRVNRNILPG